MGVDYSAHVGYGVAIETDSYTDEDELAEWLEENGYTNIDWAPGGDWMNGDYVNLFYVSDTFERIDYRYSSERVLSFDAPEITPEQTQELERLCDEFYIPRDSIGWKLVFNVS